MQQEEDVTHPPGDLPTPAVISPIRSHWGLVRGQGEGRDDGDA